MLSYVIISFDNFTPNATNPEFRDCTVTFDIICHSDYWDIGNYRQRPLKIAGYIDGLLNDCKLTGIGTLEFFGAEKIMLTDEFGGLCLTYRVVHGGEDKKNMPNPMDEIDFLENFNEIFNN